MNVGILGAGQLARMLALAGIPLGLRFQTLAPVADPASGDLASHDAASYDDREAIRTFGRAVDVVTFETESVPVGTLDLLLGLAPVLPGPRSLATTQDRVRERELLTRLAIPGPRWATASSLPGLATALRTIGVPAVVKTTTDGYDGRGQMVANDLSDAREIWFALGQRPLIVEELIRFRRELSIIGVRDRHGRIEFYPPAQNEHHDGQLRVSIAPAPDLDPAIETTARSYATAIMDELGHVGVLTVELFECDGGLLVNEIAPRVHNSGHWTIEGAITSQFENHLRAVCGLPIGSTQARGHSAMVNLIGALPPLDAWPDLRVHRYGTRPKPGRKVGHITVVDPDHRTVARTVSRIVDALGTHEAAPTRAQGAHPAGIGRL